MFAYDTFIFNRYTTYGDSYYLHSDMDFFYYLHIAPSVIKKPVHSSLLQKSR